MVDHARDLDQVDRNAMAPPKLARNAPILDVLQPLEPSLLMRLGHDLEVLVPDSVD